MESISSSFVSLKLEVGLVVRHSSLRTIPHLAGGLNQVKAEIKQWIKDFQDSEGRPPTNEDKVGTRLSIPGVAFLPGRPKLVFVTFDMKLKEVRP